MFKFLPAFCLLSLLLLTGCSSVPETPKSGPPVVTRSEVEQLKTGQTLEQVQQVIGDPGKQVSSGEMKGRSMATYSWQNPDGSGLTVMLENGQMTTASPTNLK